MKMKEEEMSRFETRSGFETDFIPIPRHCAVKSPSISQTVLLAVDGQSGTKYGSLVEVTISVRCQGVLNRVLCRAMIPCAGRNIYQDISLHL